jgi:hypothetical protein
MKRLALAVAICAALTTSSLAVSVGEIISKCGSDSDLYCKGVGYGDPMQACLVANYSKLSKECKVVVDRIRNGEAVSLF